MPGIRKVGLLLIGFLAVACGPATEGRWRTRGCPIIGGQEDTNPAHDAVVAIYDSANSYLCTGTLISPRVVLTAAHCLTSSSMQVGFGNNVNQVDWLTVRERHPHPQYDSQYLVNDIAVLVFSGSPPPGVVPIPHLPPGLQISDADLGRSLEYVGFGATEGTGDGAGIKRTMTNTLSWICTSAWCGWDNPGQTNTFCQDQTPTGICSGDSGGPALVVRDGREYVAGVTSYSAEDCLHFGCSTKVDEFASFLADFVGAALGESCQDNFDCALGFCVDGVCCESACSQDCRTCNLPGFAGSCRMVPNGSECPDGNLCNGQETCQGGECLAGTPLQCGEPLPCTQVGCDPQSGCVSEPLADGAPCPDASLCNGSEICLGGVCQPGTSLDCDDGNICTTNWCEPQEGCRQEARPDGYPCSDSGQRMCLSGQCVEVSEEDPSGCGCAAGRPGSACFWALLALGILALLVDRRN